MRLLHAVDLRAAYSTSEIPSEVFLSIFDFKKSQTALRIIPV